jgi:hypothetical protein
MGSNEEGFKLIDRSSFIRTEMPQKQDNHGDSIATAGFQRNRHLASLNVGHEANLPSKLKQNL